MKVVSNRKFEGDILFHFGYAGQMPKEFAEFRQDAKSFEGKLGQVYSAPVRSKDYSRLAFVSLGEKKEFEPDFLRRAAGTAVRVAKSMKKTKIGFVVPHINDAPKLLAEGAILADYKFVKLKSKTEDKPIDALTMVSAGDLTKQINTGIILAESQNYMRELNEQPSNIMTPGKIAAEALSLGKKYRSLSVRVYDERDLKKMKMGAILSVSKGSAEPPKFVVIEYKGAKKPFYGLMGKGITFDSGGISLKPSKNMHEMKYDKSGALAVLGSMRAAAELKLPIRVMAVLALAENMPSGTAQKPGDVWKAYNGKTIEVLNTDAEGRLVMADSLAYLSEKKPDFIIDIATLTGSIVVALGRNAIGLFSNDDRLAQAVETAGNRSYERVWRMPLWKEYFEMMKSDVADMKNVSNTGEAGAVTGAIFLKEFIGDVKWAHLDIAGFMNITNSHPYLEKGVASGTGVRLITETFILFSEKKK